MRMKTAELATANSTTLWPPGSAQLSEFGHGGQTMIAVLAIDLGPRNVEKMVKLAALGARRSDPIGLLNRSDLSIAAAFLERVPGIEQGFAG
jgi:hypothetical protein